MSDTSAYLNYQNDPTWLAYLRALDYQSSEAKRVAEEGVGRVRTRLAQQIPEFEQSGMWERERISGSMEGRGLYRSGEHETNLARQRIMQARQINASNMAAATGIADIYGNLAGQLGGFGARRAEVELNAAQQAAAFKAASEQQQRQIAEERAYSTGIRAEDRAYNKQQQDAEIARQNQYRQEDIARTSAENEKAYQRQMELYERQQRGYSQPTTYDSSSSPAYNQPGYTGMRPAS